jgi:hypothetical protein
VSKGHATSLHLFHPAGFRTITLITPISSAHCGVPHARGDTGDKEKWRLEASCEKYRAMRLLRNSYVLLSASMGLTTLTCSADTESVRGSAGNPGVRGASAGNAEAGAAGTGNAEAGAAGTGNAEAGAAGTGNGDECSMDEEYCDGNVAWYCNGGGDMGPLKWFSRECSADTVCIKGACLREPLVPCDKSEVNRDACSPDKRHVGWCSNSGYYQWMFDCVEDRGEICEAFHHVSSSEDEMWVSCVLSPFESCTGAQVRSCQGDLVTECTSVSYWGWVEDCAANGLVCQDGACAEP